MVPAVPEVVPHLEPVALDEVHPQQMGRQVGPAPANHDGEHRQSTSDGGGDERHRQDGGADVPLVPVVAGRGGVSATGGPARASHDAPILSPALRPCSPDEGPTIRCDQDANADVPMATARGPERGLGQVQGHMEWAGISPRVGPLPPGE